MKSIKNTAKTYIEAGLSVIPVNDKKEPVNLLEWTPYCTRRASDKEIKTMFTGADVFGIAVICGKISGDLECLDFDDKGSAFDGWKQKIPLQLYSRLTVERSPSGGYHVYYRCSTIGNYTVFYRYKDDKKFTLIEVRGNKHYTICDPTPGYSLIQGSMLEVQTITPAERETF